MEPAGHIAPQDWMNHPATRAVLDALQVEGTAVRFVGGCVRDSLIARPVQDIDIATPDPPERVMELLQRAGLKAVPTGLQHGTVTAVSDHHPFEITTLREDVETYGRHAQVAFTDDWTADAARRDFTINAISCAPDGTVYDPFGGWSDLLAGRVRFVGEPGQRIQEDYLRLLRFFRFHAYYGQGPPDPEGLAAATVYAPHLKGLSAERVREELFKLLKAPDPAPVVQVMTDFRILAAVLPEATEAVRLTALVHWEQATGIAGEPVRRLAAVLARKGTDIDSITERLRLSRQERKHLAVLLDPAADHLPTPGQPLHVALYRCGPELVRDRLLLATANRVTGGECVDITQLEAALAEMRAWQAPQLPVGGADVQALGIPEGPQVGKLLRAVEDWWLAADLRPGREECLAKLRELAGQVQS